MQNIVADNKYIKDNLPIRAADANKGDCGRLLLIAGSYGMAGACIMAARAALRCGVGILQIAVDSKIYPIVAAAVPEAVFTVLNFDDDENISDSFAGLNTALENCTACVVGCGLGKLSGHICPHVFDNCNRPLLIDADGINYVAKNPKVLEKCAAPLILTPHPKEMSRLTGKSVEQIQGKRKENAVETAKKLNAVLLLKGEHTIISSSLGDFAINPTGNEGMAKGGSGDVLSGIIGSLCAQGVLPFEAAVSGAYIHGMAGDICAGKFSKRAMLPTDLIEELPTVFRQFE